MEDATEREINREDVCDKIEEVPERNFRLSIINGKSVKYARIHYVCGK